jgi:hypothetical protein
MIYPNTIYPENSSNIDIVTYIKNIMKKEGIFYAREPLAINNINFNRSGEFYKYPPKLREYGMNNIIKSGYLGKDIIVLYRRPKGKVKWDISSTDSKTDAELNNWLTSSKSNPDMGKWRIVSNNVPYIFFNIDVIDFINIEEVIDDERRLFLHIKSYSGNTDSFSISKDEYDEIIERIKSLERYDILLRTGI